MSATDSLSTSSAMKSAAHRTTAWLWSMEKIQRGLSDRDLYLASLRGWADMYVHGDWTLEQFEEHADRMMPFALGKR